MYGTDTYTIQVFLMVTDSPVTAAARKVVWNLNRMDLGGGIHISDLLEDTRVFLQERDGGAGGGREEGGAGGGREEEGAGGGREEEE